MRSAMESHNLNAAPARHDVALPMMTRRVNDAMSVDRVTVRHVGSAPLATGIVRRCNTTRRATRVALRGSFEGCHAACSILASISPRSEAKSIGLV